MHGAQETANAERASAVLFGSSLATRTGDGDSDRVRRCAVGGDRAAALAEGVATTELVVLAGLAASKGEAARLIKQGGLYVNDQRVTEERGRLTLEHAIDGRVIVLRKGQRERRLIRVTSGRGN